MLELALNLIADVGEFVAQVDPYGGTGADPWNDDTASAGSLGFGALLMILLLGLGVSVLFGFWAKSRGDDHGIHPVMSFCAGFFMGWIGVLIVPLLKTDRIVNPPRRPAPLMPNKPYGGQPYPPQAPPPPGPPPPMPDYPQQPGPMLKYEPAQPAPNAEPSHVLVPDEQGYVECPACHARTKSGRKSCMTCGVVLPPVFEP